MMHVVAEGVQLIQPNAEPCTAQFHREGLRILVDSLLCFHALRRLDVELCRLIGSDRRNPLHRCDGQQTPGENLVLEPE